MSVSGRLKRFLRKEEDEARRRGVGVQNPPISVAHSEPVRPTVPSRRTDADEEVKEVAATAKASPTPRRDSPEGPLSEHRLMQEDRERSKRPTPTPRPVLHPVGHTPSPEKAPDTAPAPAATLAPAVAPVPYVLAPYPYPPPYVAAPYGPYAAAPNGVGEDPSSSRKESGGHPPKTHNPHQHHHHHRAGADKFRNAKIIEQQRREARAAAELSKSDDDEVEEKLLEDEVSVISGASRAGLRRRRGPRGSMPSWEDDDHVSQVASRIEAEIEAAEQREKEEEEEEQAQRLRIILEPSTENEVVSIVEVGAIACLSGRLPGVSIFYAGVLFIVVALASSVLMSAAQSSYEGIPCEDDIECYQGSFCNTVTTGNGLGICTSCFTREYETTYNFFGLIEELLNSNRGSEVTFNGTEILEDGYTYLCPMLVEDPTACVERCEQGGCIEPQYLTFFSFDEPATIVVAVFIIVFFALLSREQQQQTLSAFFYMRHEVKYRPLKELSKRLKLAKKRDKRFRAREAKKPEIPRVETKAESSDAEDEEDAALRREAEDVDDILNPIEDDFSSVSSEGTLEGRVNTFRFLCAVYSESALQVVLQIVALPLMRVALFIELVSLRTAVLVSTVTILFSNATILDFLVNSLAVLFVLELDEAIFNTVNQSFPGVVTNYILVHQHSELEEHKKRVLHKRRKAARKEGIPLESVRTDDLDHGYKPTFPQIELTVFETNLLRFSCVLHAVTVFVYSLWMLILPSERCFSNGEAYLRFVWTTAIFILWGEVFFSTAVHFVYNYYDSGRNLQYLPIFFMIFATWQIVQFLLVFMFQNYLFEELQREYSI